MGDMATSDRNTATKRATHRGLTKQNTDRIRPDQHSTGQYSKEQNVTPNNNLRQRQTTPHHNTKHSTAPDSSPRHTGPAHHSATQNAQRSGPAPQQNTSHRAQNTAKRNSTGHRTQQKETAQQTTTQQQPPKPPVPSRAYSKVATKLQSATLRGSGTTTKFTKL